MDAVDRDPADMTCGRYAVQRGLLPSSFDFSVSKSAAPLGAALVRRPASLNSKRAAAFTTKKPQNVVALFIQLSGEEPVQRCRTCRQGNGLWAECVVSTHADVQAATQGACANCYYNGLGSKCSFRQNQSVRIRVRRSRDVQSPSTLPIQFPPESIEAVTFDQSMLQMKLDLLRRELEGVYWQLFLLRILRCSPQAKFTDFLREKFPDHAHIFDFAPEERQHYAEVLQCEQRVQEERIAFLSVLKQHLGKSSADVDVHVSPVSKAAGAEG